MAAGTPRRRKNTSFGIFPFNYLGLPNGKHLCIFFPKNPHAVLHDGKWLPRSAPAAAGSESLQICISRDTRAKAVRQTPVKQSTIQHRWRTPDMGRVHLRLCLFLGGWDSRSDTKPQQGGLGLKGPFISLPGSLLFCREKVLINSFFNCYLLK